MGIKTIEEARALPEIPISEAYTTPFGPVGFEGDDIVMFVDADGYSKQVLSGPDGFAKMLMGF